MKTVLYAILITVTTIGLSACEDYSYDFAALRLDFSTPEGNPVIEIRDNDNTNFIFIILQNGTSMYGIIEEPSLLDNRSLTPENAELLWIGRNKEHSPLTKIRLKNGDYVVSGRYLDGQSMHTQAVTVIDLNNDGKIDYYVQWVAFEKIDLDLITYIAEHTKLGTFEPKWD